MSLTQRLRALPPLTPLSGVEQRTVSGEVPQSPAFALSEVGIAPESPLEKVIAVARHTGIPQALGLAAEGLARVDTAFRQGILVAGGAVPIEEFPSKFARALDGDFEMSNREFMELYLSKELMANMAGIEVVPHWAKVAMNALPWVANVDKREKPLVSIANVLDFSADIWATPFALMAGTPKAAGTALAKLPIWSPLRSVTRGVDSLFFNTASRLPNPIASLLIHTREPLRALERHPEATAALQDARDLLTKNIVAQAPTLHNIFFEDQKALGVVARSMRKYTQVEERVAFSKLFGEKNFAHLGLPAATARTDALADELMSKVFTPLMQRGQAMGYVAKGWHPGEYLEAVLPSFVDLKSIPQDIMQSWSWKTLGVLRSYVLSKKAQPGKAATIGKLGLTENNIDLVTASRDFVYAMERKLVWNARHRSTTTTPRTIKTGVIDEFGNPVTKTILATRSTWVSDGPLLKYKPRPTTIPTRQNPNVRDWSLSERNYMKNFINEIQGHARGRETLIIGEMSRRFFTSLKEGAERNRVLKYPWAGIKRVLPAQGSYDFPEFSKPQYASRFFTHNVVRSVLWGNLGSAIKNTSQLLNTATVEGLPATLKGMFKMANGEYRALAGREVSNEFKRLLSDETCQQLLGARLDNVMMGPFNFVENFARGTAFNVYLDDFMKQARIPSLSALKASTKYEEAVRYAVRGSHETNFVYGVLGRPASFLGSPMLRPVTTLLSYGPKQAEFYRRAFINDGSAVIRAIGLHGWAIDFANKQLGIAPESWLGWGFIPPSRSLEGLPLAASPQVNFALAIAEGLGAIASGHENEASAHFRRASGSVGQILDTAPQLKAAISGQMAPEEILAQSFDNEALGVILGGAQALGWMPLPTVAIAKTMRSAVMFKTGVTPSQSGATWVPITRHDAVKSYFLQTTIQRSRAQLDNMTLKARARVDRELDARVGRYVSIVNKPGAEGDDILEAAAQLTAPIRISHGLVREPPATFLPYPEQIETRITTQIANRSTNRDLLEMEEAGWLQDVYWAQYLNLLLRDLEAQE